MMPGLKARFALALEACRATAPGGPIGGVSPVLRGALLVLASATCVAVDTILARIVTQEVSSFVLVFFRNLFGFLLVAPWLVRVGRAAFATPRMDLHVARAALKIAGLVCFFFGLSIVPVAEATAIAFATPLFAAVGAALFLGETLRHGRLAAILLGFLGVLIVLRPGGSALHVGALAVLASTVSLAAIGLLAKRLARHDPPNTILAINLTLSVPLALLAAIPFWTTPTLPTLGLMALQGALGAASQFCFVRALQLADASLMMPVDFIRLPLVALLGYFAFDQVPDGWTWTGAVVICTAIVLLLRAGTRVRTTVAAAGRKR
jgi:drug/metabolite transporter (DMT)-like permease